MIFVTVGTHEQQFNRLIEYMDKWATENAEEVIIQTGYSTYEPQNCKWQKLFSYQEMCKYVDAARIVITHAIENREEFGHWEMDMVVGKKNVSKNVLLVLSERKTREELIFKLPTKEAKGVVEVLDLLESQYGDKFSKIFKTITVDNGTEFSLCEDMEKSLYGGQRTKMYYCHAYSSWERGTNENQNKLVRRKVPKGSDFDHYTEEQVKEIETWMNHYPRKIFNWRTSHDLFSEEIALII